MIRVGKIPYLNSVLFYHTMESSSRVALEPLVPRQLSGAAVEDQVDAGPVPLVTCWDIEGRYAPLGDFCISTVNKARSILLYSKRPFEKLAGAAIGVTGETSTSVRLLNVLLTHVYRVTSPRFVHLDWPRNDAFLLIGDEALIHRRGVKGYPHVADLGEVWNEWTGLPFVFALWVARHDLDPEAASFLVGELEQSLESGWEQLDAVCATRAHDIGMSAQEAREYLEGFRFRLTDDEREAMKRFRQLDDATRAATVESPAQK